MAKMNIMRNLVVALFAIIILGLIGSLIPGLFTIPAGIPVIGGITAGQIIAMSIAIVVAGMGADRIKQLN